MAGQGYVRQHVPPADAASQRQFVALRLSAVVAGALFTTISALSALHALPLAQQPEGPERRRLAGARV